MSNPNPMHNRDPDLELNLLDSDSLHANQPYVAPSPNARPASLTVRQNLMEDMRARIYGSIAYCLASIAISLFKIIISFVFVLSDYTTCNQPIDQYFKYMIIHDIACAIILSLRLATIISIFSGTNLQAQVRVPAYIVPLGQQGINIEIPNPAYSANHLSHEQLNRYKWRFRIIAALYALTNVYYCLLFLYAHFIYFQPESDCAELAPMKNALMLSYLILGYVFVGIPTISFLLICFCLPFLLLGFYLFRKDPNAASKKLIDKLPVKKYTPDLGGDIECSICMGEYTPQDNIIQLKCSPLHFFHEKCIKKWLRINGQCPICRQGLDKAQNQRNTDVEMQNLPQGARE